MPSDAWADLNRRAAAVPGGVPWAVGMRDENGQLVTGVGGGGAIHSVWGRRNGKRTGRPDLSHAGTRGILRAALGLSTVILQPIFTPGDTIRSWVCELRAIREDPPWVATQPILAHGHGATIEQAEAAALVALAEARGQWGPG